MVQLHAVRPLVCLLFISRNYKGSSAVARMPFKSMIRGRLLATKMPNFFNANYWQILKFKYQRFLCLRIDAFTRQFSFNFFPITRFHSIARAEGHSPDELIGLLLSSAYWRSWKYLWIWYAASFVMVCGRSVIKLCLQLSWGARVLLGSFSKSPQSLIY